MINIVQSEIDEKWYFIHASKDSGNSFLTLLFDEGTSRKKAEAILKELCSRGLSGDVPLAEVVEKIELVRSASLAVGYNIPTLKITEFFDHKENGTDFYF